MFSREHQILYNLPYHINPTLLQLVPVSLSTHFSTHYLAILRSYNLPPPSFPTHLPFSTFPATLPYLTPPPLSSSLTTLFLHMLPLPHPLPTSFLLHLSSISYHLSITLHLLQLPFSLSVSLSSPLLLSSILIFSPPSLNSHPSPLPRSILSLLLFYNFLLVRYLF